MNRRLIGSFEQTYSAQPPSPRIPVNAIADIGRPAHRVLLLIDTGADRTLIAPDDAGYIFGRQEYAEINRSAHRLSIGGVGMGASVVERQVFLSFLPETGLPILALQNIWIATELRDDEGHVVNADMPSLLGRDILNHFTLTISPVRGLVELIEEESLAGSV